MAILTLCEVGLIKEIDRQPLFPRFSPSPLGLFEWVTPKLAQQFFHPILLKASPLFALFLSFLLITRSETLPKSSDFFWSDRQSLNLLTFSLFSWLSLIIHELAHFLAARSFGASASFRFSSRLNFLVVETRLSNIFSVPKTKRLITYGAGILADFYILVGGLLIILFKDYLSFLHPLVFPLIKQLLLLQLISLLWQFLLFMRTDVYFFFTDLFDFPYLWKNTKRFLLDILRNGRSAFTLTGFSPREKRAIYTYSILLFAGSLIIILRYTLYHIPIVVGLLFKAARHLESGLLYKRWDLVLDAFIVFIVESSYLSGLGLIILRRLIKKD